MDPKLLQLILSRAFKPVGDDMLMAAGTAKLVLSDNDRDRAKEIKAQLDSGGAFKANTREELEPQEGDFIYPVYRLISQAVMDCYGLDYRRPGVLEAAVPMAQGKAVYPDHRTEVERWIGKVEAAWWDNPAESESPFDVPGINGKLKVDWKANPKIARGILTGILDSVSFTNTFIWQKSHPDLRDWQFWDMLGHQVDGHTVLVEVMQVVSLEELSIVWAGADTRAKKISAGAELVLGPEANPTEAAEKVFSVGPMFVGSEIKLTEKPVFQEPSAGSEIEPLDGGKQMDPKLIAILASLKVETPEEALAKVQELAARPAPDEGLIALGKQLDAKGVKHADAVALVESGKVYREQLAEEMNTFARLALCDTEDGQLPEGFSESQANLSPQQLASQVKFFKAQAEKKYPPRCQSCNSTDISSQVSAKPELGDEEGDQQQKRQLDLSNIHK